MTERIKIGTPVTITKGMKEFVGKTGNVIEIDRSASNEGPMYRIRLDEPVNIPGVGEVSEDLWSSKYFTRQVVANQPVRRY